MNNAQIADALDLIADLLELQSANAFRVRAYRRGAQAVRESGESLARVAAEQPERLTAIEGIGKDLANKIVLLAATGSVPLLDELKAQIPSGVLELMRIPGLGPKKAAVLHRELGITTLDQLREACQANRVRTLKGFGAKTEEVIAAGIDLAASANQRIYWAKADEFARELLAHLRSVAAIERLEVAGSYRRGRETIGDLDILAIAGNATAAMDRLAQFEGVEVSRPRRHQDDRSTRGGFKSICGSCRPSSFGAALQYFTGSKDHNVVLRGWPRAGA